jgi:ribosomal protein S25
MSQNITVSKNEIVTVVNTEINNLEKDSFFREAAELIVEFQKVSEDFLKDKLKLGTNRARRLIEQLETKGLIDKINENNEYKINIRNGVFLDHFLISGEIKKIYEYSFKNLTLLEKSNGAIIPNLNEDGYKCNLKIGDRFMEMSLWDEEDFEICFLPKVLYGFKGIDEFFKEIKPKDDYMQFFEKLFAFGTSYKKIKKYPNGDFFLGKIVDEKANGFGELTITSNDLFSNKKTKYIGHFFNDTFLEGTIICYKPDEIIALHALQNDYDCTEYRDVRLLNNKYLCSSIYYPNGDNFEGTVINFKEHGKGKIHKSDDLVIGTWENGTCLEYSSLKKYKQTISSLWYEKKYLECITEFKKAESLFKDLFKDSATAENYLWSLMEVDLEKAYEEINRVTNIVEDKSKLQNIFGQIYQKKGTKTNDLTILNKALHCFKSHNFWDKSKGEERIKNVQEIINRIVSNSNKELEATKVFSGTSLNQEKLKSLGVNSEIIKQFTNNDYKKLWKVSCLITEPYYNYKNTISNWQNSNPNFFIPSNGIINEKGAVAFIKANWTNIYVYRVDKYWEKKGSNCDKFKSFDKTKIEIIEINEIV